MARAAATPVVHIDDDRFKVTEWRFAPAAETGWHVHGHDYVIVPLTDGTLRLEEPGGTSREAHLQHHVPYSRRTGVEHNVINGCDGPLAFWRSRWWTIICASVARLSSSASWTPGTTTTWTH